MQKLEETKNDAIEAGVSKEDWEKALKRFGKNKTPDDKLQMLYLMSEATLKSLFGEMEGGIVYVQLQVEKQKEKPSVKVETTLQAQTPTTQPILVNSKFTR